MTAARAWIMSAVFVAASLTAQPVAAQPVAAQPADPLPKAPARPQYTDALRLVDAWLDAARDYDRLAGLSAAVVSGEDTIWSQGYGTIDVERRVPATARTLYSICSISKPFTAVAIMQLVEAGTLRLDDDIATVLPGFDIGRSDPDSGPITLRGMLSHSSGLPNEAAYTAWTGPDHRFATAEEIRRGLKDLRTAMRAGEYFQYSNLAMGLLGQVVERASGMPYARYVERHILAPLQLSETRVGMPMDLYGKQLAQGFGPIKRDGTRDPARPFDAAGYMSAAGLTSNVLDIARFAAWQFRLLRRGGAELLRVATLREMHRVQWSDPDGRAVMGLGFFVAYAGTTKTVSHGGACPGYYSALVMVPKDELAVVVMTNNQVNISEYSRPVRALLEKGARLPARPTGAGAPDLEAYAGIYNRRNRGGEEAIVPWGAGLAVLGLPSRDPAGALDTLRHVSGDTFRRVRDDGSLAGTVEFLRDAGGRVTGYRNEHQLSSRMRALPR